MKPSQFFLSPVNLGGLAILILLEVVVTIVCCVGALAGASRGILSGRDTSVLPPSLGLARMVPIHPVVVSTGFTTSPTS